MKRDPLMSQLHIYQYPPPTGKGWRIAGDSRIATHLDNQLYHDLNHKEKWNRHNTAHLSTILIDTTLWGQFSGPTCTFHKLQRVWKKLQPLADRTVTGLDHWPELLSIDLDCSTPIRKSITLDCHIDLVSALAQDKPDAIILLLGHAKKERLEGPPLNRLIGLLLVPSSYNERLVWQRIGLFLDT
jgi:hypothetical protein